MANITQYTGGTADASGRTIGQWVGDEDAYEAIKLVSDPNDIDNYDVDSDDFYPAFADTLFFVVENSDL